jgi:ABC-type sugar transport system ATPase subunit
MMFAGPFGCGTTMVPRMVAGSRRSAKGAIRIAECAVNDVSAKDRSALEYSLRSGPSLTVRST